MKSKLLKTWFIVAFSFVGLGVLYYLVLLFDIVLNPLETSQVLKTLNWVAIGLFVVALIMILLSTPLAKWIDKKNSSKKVVTVDEQQVLNKYKSKKTK
ncbi:MAG: hypothetical protein WC008_01040 [Bacilli bacterium]